MKKIAYILSAFLCLQACQTSEVKKKEEKNTTPIVSQDGQNISFPSTETLTFFKTERIGISNINADFTAIGHVGATIMASNTGASQNIVLFENPDLAGNYTQIVQHQINIRQIQNVNIKKKQIELKRMEDLNAHGVATGQDLLNAQTGLSMEETNLANERAALIEHEVKLKSGGFEPKLLQNATAGTAYIICDIPENQVSKIQEGNTCKITFSSFPDEKFTGKIEDVADVVDNATRMIKVRVSVNNSSNKIKAGMFANISFGLHEGSFITIHKTALVTVQGKNYVFVRKSNHEIERREIQTGQQLGDSLVVFSGLKDGEEIAIQGVVQLKGLSFGY